MSEIEEKKKKIEWLSVLQGFSMLLVVIGHVSLTNVPGDPTTPIATGIEKVIYSFHMLSDFLMGIFFQMAIRWTFVKWGNDMLFVPMWLLSIVIGIYAPTFIAKIIEKKTPKYVKMCFGL